MDREKVIKSIEGCINIDDYCNDCDYNGCIYTHGNCEKDLLADALALLKEQEAASPYQFEDIWKCGNCVDGVVAYEELGVSGIEEVKFNYCPTCGRRVLWGGR